VIPLLLSRCVEVVLSSVTAHDTKSADLAGPAPGSVARGDYAQTALHFAPDRWLLIEPDQARIDCLVAGGAHVFEVLGKWQAFRVSTPEEQYALEAGFDLECVLRERSCARLLLYDCPVIVARQASDTFIYVESSYTESLCSRMKPCSGDDTQ
jgi:sarcosine oxidase gamma subunit